MIKRALISVWNKDGLIELANFLVKHKIEIISTGGTAKYLEDNKNIDLLAEGMEQVSSDSFLIFGFDKINGEPLTNGETPPFILKDVFEAISFFYHQSFKFDYDLRFNGYTLCKVNRKYSGSNS